MSNNTSCDHLGPGPWPVPPHFTYSALAWLAPGNNTAFDTLQNCCGGPAWPLQFYENGCLVWCETSDDWSKALDCARDNSFPTGIYIGTTPGTYRLNSSELKLWFPEDPDPPFAMVESMPPFTQCRQTRELKIDYCVPEDVEDAESADTKAGSMDKHVEAIRIKQLRGACDSELLRRKRLAAEARGWFGGWLFQDQSKMQQARDMKMKSCGLLYEMENRMAQSGMVYEGWNWVGLVMLLIICSKIFGLWDRIIILLTLGRP
jgi:hypothetical protein